MDSLLTEALGSAQLTLIPLGGLGEIGPQHDGAQLRARHRGDRPPGLMFPEQEMLGATW